MATPITGALLSRRACALTLLAATGLVAAGCGASATGDGKPASSVESAVVTVTTSTALERPVVHYIRVTGTLTAREQAEVAAEVGGRVVATPVERGTRVASGAVLVKIATTEVTAQAREAEANAAQLEARLGLENGGDFTIERVPEVANARAALELAQTDFERVRMLYDKKLVSQAEFDLRSAQAEAARRQFEVVRNGAAQQYQALVAARARLALARKALDDTTVRAPFDGAVGERLVSVGDYVVRGTKVASVMRIDPIRVELTVPEQYIAEVAAGRTVTLEVNAYPGRTFTGQIRYVSPALRTDSRALVVEAIVSNPSGELKPGFFAIARIAQASPKPAVLVPAASIRTISDAARVYVVSGGTIEERIVTTGQQVNDLVEITSGVKAGEDVATSNIGQLSDGVRVAASR